jgi:glycosyltransferase involved in cell wall biosynthesis
MIYPEVTVVIPAKNAAATIAKCLGSVLPLQEQGQVKETILVDDGSTDTTEAIVRTFPVRYVKGLAKGPASARNLGWKAADTSYVWFIDSDCVVQPDALTILLENMRETQVAAAGGTYENLYPESLLASLIHEEIVERHLAMPAEVTFLATFNALFKREWLESVNGFNELFVTAEDADLAFRIRARGGVLRFDRRSKVGHHHPTNFWQYLQTQRRHGYWRAWLYIEHPERMVGDSYSGFIDHIQPPLAILSLLTALIFPLGALAPFFTVFLIAAQIPMTWQIVRRTADSRFCAFGVMSFIRAYARAIGMLQGSIDVLLKRLRDKK